MQPPPSPLYKWLGPNGEPANGGSGAWPLPRGKRPGAWRKITGDLIPCKNGLHLCRQKDLLDWCGPELWVAEARGEWTDGGDKIVVREARLLRRVTAWNDRTARLFACDEAERVATEAGQREVIAAARRFAEGAATATELAAARAAAWKAARDAVRAAARAAAWKAARDAARAAAWEAAWAAAWDAARAAAWEAAWAAARAAAWAAARAAAWDAARDAYRKKQCRRLATRLSDFTEAS